MTNSAEREQWAKDDMTLKKKLVDLLKTSTGNNRITFPENIFLEETENGIKISLNMAAVGRGKNKLNMQSDAAAFEGWAAVIYTHYLKPLNNEDSGKRKIILDTQKKLDENPDFNKMKGHYPRFLYRAMKFSEEYDWLDLDHNLDKVVGLFKLWYEKEKLVNNYPTKDSSQDNSKAIENPKTENEVENYFYNNNNERKKLLELADMKTEDLFRQLPVGLFKEKVADNNSVFTGGKSAIDLWAVDNENIAIFELKTNNKMVGIITELFFYSEYVNDVFINRNNIQCTKVKTNKRGYSFLTTDETVNKKIKAFFLTNGLHPLITKEVIELLNANNKGIIKYADIEYDFK